MEQVAETATWDALPGVRTERSPAPAWQLSQVSLSAADHDRASALQALSVHPRADPQLLHAR